MENKFEKLSEAEERVLIKIMEGYKVRELAPLLFIAVDTAQNHTKSIRKKFGKVTIAACVYRAMRSNAIDEKDLPEL